MDWFSSDSFERIITVSADRNAYVWSRKEGTKDWSESLCLLRFKRGATCVSWSPDGTMFAVGGSEGLISVGSYEAEDDWWVCRHLKSIIAKETILSICWAKDGQSLFASSLKKSSITHLSLKDSIIKEWNNESISHSITLNPSGTLVGACGHDGKIRILSLQDSSVTEISVSTNPLYRLVFDGEDRIIFSDWISSAPFCLSKKESSWIAGEQQPKALSPLKSGETKKKDNVFSGAFAKFKAMDLKGTDSTTTTNVDNDSVGHLNFITQISIRDSLVYTSGMDGKIICWNC